MIEHQTAMVLLLPSSLPIGRAGQLGTSLVEGRRKAVQIVEGWTPATEGKT